MLRRSGASLFIAACGVVVVGADLADGSPWQALAWALVLGALAFMLSPAFFPRSESTATALARSADDGWPVVYWRPGCQFCLRLRLRLGRRGGRLHWVDIWRDPQAAAEVRAITGGDETVPTVVAGDQTQVNPDPQWVRDRMPALRR